MTELDPRAQGGALMNPSAEIYNRLLKDRIVFLGTEVDDDIANIICAQLLYLEGEDTESDIWLYINSPGGSVTAGMAIYDTMQFVRPDVATMNRAHTTHYSNFPDPAIGHVLRGWSLDGGPGKHDLVVGDVRIRNVATNIRDWNGGYIPYGNSIFIFELAGLCLGHLGHLHHTLTEQQIAQIGQLDVVMVPVDGSYTMDVAGMVEVLKVLRARLILPMHYFNPYTLQRFLDRIRNDFPVETATVASIVVSQSTLPSEPKVLVLPGH